MWIDVFCDVSGLIQTGEFISGQSYGKCFSPKRLICSIVDTLLLRTLLLVHIVRQHQEKIFVKHQGNAREQRSVDTVFLEKAIDIRTVNTPFAGKP